MTSCTAAIAMVCRLIILPSVPPEEFAAAISVGDTPTLSAVMTWNVTKRPFTEVSEPVRETPSSQA
jgi:hypothetical protein